MYFLALFSLFVFVDFNCKNKLIKILAIGKKTTPTLNTCTVADLH